MKVSQKLLNLSLKHLKLKLPAPTLLSLGRTERSRAFSIIETDHSEITI